MNARPGVLRLDLRDSALDGVGNSRGHCDIKVLDVDWLLLLVDNVD